MEPVALFVGGLVTGLVAGTASCTAVQGGLLAGLTPGASPASLGGVRSLSGRARRPPPDRRRPPPPVPGQCCHAPAGLSGPKAVALFLTGRLASHLAAGVLLGLAGSAVRLAPGARAVLLVVAGLAVIGFGLRTFARGPVRPVSPAGSAGRAQAPPGTRRAVLLGAATVLLPCGVTLSAEAVAVSSGSALGGAAVMAGFTAGTAPAFALLGLALRRVATTRLAALAGVLALAAGVWTVATGLRLGGWLPGPAVFAATTSTAGAPTGTGPRPVRADGVQRIDIWATDRGYRPGIVTARAGVPVEIAFHLAGNPGCTRTLTLAGRDETLPAVLRLGPQPAGTLRYSCSMGMYAGFVVFS
ncbi:sulfite exporter TauE/SafE family protein [Planomonospora sp. ID67723]|uniref:sulfite exporter TauE/SafE family protein n=1 Tax=Planomonospora sp. ID67723 TaxID=2738134 RepID=UPI0018C360D4|nr:sulfite exporter TauE/SafE family protein [Planomonospora sp. ID67723]MBG0828171.1 sulfite exporter TauE/SafE family protein [Planomonospora sp. ID67723]